MPNHVTTICTVTGPSADVAAFVERHIVHHPERTVPCEWGDRTRTVKAHDAFEFQTIIPQPAILEGTISGSGLTSKQEEHRLRAHKETRFSDWYEWSIENWGTKWGAYDYEELYRGDGRFVFKFETAWSFPEKVFRKLAELHPSLVIDVLSYDEGGRFACNGEFNGKNNYRCSRDLTTDEMYERVYGRKPDRDED